MLKERRSPVCVYPKAGGTKYPNSENTTSSAWGRLTPEEQVTIAEQLLVFDPPLQEAIITSNLSSAKNASEEVMDSLSVALANIFQRNDKLVEMLSFAIRKEIEYTVAEAQMFRGVALVVKIWGQFCHHAGRAILQRVALPIQELLAQKNLQRYEVDPVRLAPSLSSASSSALRMAPPVPESSNATTASTLNPSNSNLSLDPQQEDLLQANRKHLRQLAIKVLDTILLSSDFFPLSMRHICVVIHGATDNKFPGAGYKALGAMLFLRFIVPAIVAPDSFGLVPGQVVSKEARRVLVLVAKIIQNMVNETCEADKEPYMACFIDLVSSSIPKLHDFFDTLLDVSEGTGSPRIIPLDKTDPIADLLVVADFIRKQLRPDQLVDNSGPAILDILTNLESSQHSSRGTTEATAATEPEKEKPTDEQQQPQQLHPPPYALPALPPLPPLPPPNQEDTDFDPIFLPQPTQDGFNPPLKRRGKDRDTEEGKDKAKDKESRGYRFRKQKSAFMYKGVSEWTSSDVSAWLAYVGEDSFVKLFYKKGIDGESLLELNQTTMLNYGISKLGDRKRLIKAIANAKSGYPRDSSGSDTSCDNSEERKTNIYSNVYMKVWGPDHVVEWLEGLGLGELKPTFKLQKVNGLLLTTATNTSLTALGVDKLGCRIKLLKNIRDYLDDTQVALMQKSPSDWTVEETQRWLCVIGFERYFHLAEQHEITGAILEELDDEDIMEMGIVKLGHRKALLKKIHALFNEAENVKQDAFRPRRSSFDIVMEDQDTQDGEIGKKLRKSPRHNGIAPEFKRKDGEKEKGEKKEKKHLRDVWLHRGGSKEHKAAGLHSITEE